MRLRRQRRPSLTNRLFALAVLVVVSTTLLLAGTSAAGVYRMAVEQEAARQTAHRDVLVAELYGNLTGAQATVVATARRSMLAGDESAAQREALQAAAVDAASYVSALYLLERPGRVLSSWPPDDGGVDIPADLIDADTPAGTPAFLWDGGGALNLGTVWVAASVPGSVGAERLLLARLRTDFVVPMLADVTLLVGSPTAIVFDDGGTPIYASRSIPSADSRSYVFTPEAADPTQGRVYADVERVEVGYYADVLVPDLGWRVGVLEPRAHAWAVTMQALRPGIIGWVAALGVALFASVAVLGTLTRPLRELERRALELAEGSGYGSGPDDDADEIERLLSAFDSVAYRFDLLSQTADLLARTVDRTRVLDGLASSIAHLVPGADVDVALAEGDQLRLVAAEGTLADELGATAVIAEVPWVAEAVRSRSATMAPEGVSDVIMEYHGGVDARAFAVPLLAGEEVIGMLVVTRRGGTAFTEAEIGAVRSFASQASVAVQNWRLFEAERSARREAEALRAIAERLASSEPVDASLREVARLHAGLVGADDARVVVAEPAAYGLDPATDPTGDRVWLDAWQIASAEVEGTAPVVVRADAADGGTTLIPEDAGWALITPLGSGDDPAGLLVAVSRSPEPLPDGHAIGLASTVGAQASLALEKARLFTQATSRADNLEIIFRISQAVASSLQSRIVLNRVLDVVQKLLAADAVMLLTYDAQRRVMTVPMARGVLHRDMLQATFRTGDDVPGRVFETRHPERYDHISGVDTPLLGVASREGLESLLAVPLLARGRSIGVLVAFARAPEAFSAEDLDLLRTFASQAALAIDTAEMFSREHHVATVLQESILPARLPRIPGIDASSVYLPAGSDAEIGGDYYDLFRTADGTVVVAMGDVCGKGVLAATKTSMIKYSVRAMAAAGLEPERILKEINEMLVETGDPENIVTLWVGCLDVGAAMLRYANAGHPPGLLLDPDTSQIARLATTGPLLGAVTDATWTRHETRVAPGGTLLLYTDGVTEARRDDDFFGEGRVRRVLRTGGQAALVTQRLLALVQRFTGGDMHDDAAILAVVFHPPGADMVFGDTEGVERGV